MSVCFLGGGGRLWRSGNCSHYHTHPQQTLPSVPQLSTTLIILHYKHIHKVLILFCYVLTLAFQQGRIQDFCQGGTNFGKNIFQISLIVGLFVSPEYSDDFHPSRTICKLGLSLNYLFFHSYLNYSEEVINQVNHSSGP